MLKKYILKMVFLSLFLVISSSAMAASLHVGDQGQSVRRMQQALINQGYLIDAADGYFGNNTLYALRVFQQEKGLDVDGIAGPQVMNALGISNVASGVPSSYRQLITMDASAYSSDDPGNSSYTAMGHYLQHGYVSVDPNVIPLGTELYIEGYGYAVADDTGGAIVGNRIDLAMNSHYDAIQFGRQSVNVYIL